MLMLGCKGFKGPSVFCSHSLSLFSTFRGDLKGLLDPRGLAVIKLVKCIVQYRTNDLSLNTLRS